MQPVSQLVRGISTSAAAAAAAPALATKSSGGLASWFGFGTARVDVPMSEPLPGVPKPLRGSLPASNKLQTSKLESGATVASLDTASPLMTVAAVVPGGSAYETDAQAGASKVLEAMAFKATTSRTTFRLTREVEKIGALAYSRAGRDTLTFGVDAVRLNAAEATEILLDSVLNAKLNYYEFKETLEAVESQLRDLQANPTNTVCEVLHRAAYDGGLGRPLLPDPSSISNLSVEAVREYAQSVLQPSRMVIAGVGIEHGQLKGLASPLVPAGKGAAAATPSSTYVGGAFNVVASSPLTYVGLAFEAKGGLSDPKAQAAAAVAKVLLDEARSALPWTRRESDVFTSVESFSHMYSNTGLVGVVASSQPKQAGALVDAVCKRVEAVAKGVSDAQLRQAKQVAIGSYKAALSTSNGALAIIAPQLLATKSFNANDFVSNVEGLTAAEVASYVQKVVKAAPTFAAYGSLAYLPRYDSIAKRFA